MQNMQSYQTKSKLAYQAYWTKTTKPKLLVKAVNTWVRSAFGNVLIGFLSGICAATWVPWLHFVKGWFFNQNIQGTCWQDLTGLWTGFLLQDSTGTELQAVP